jgi:cytidine deaminase
MKDINVSCIFETYDSLDELAAADRELLLAADLAADDAYAPYSMFQVGSALRLENGKILKGNNQENVAYPSGLCAERVVLFFASANYPGQVVEAIAVTAKTGNFEINEPTTPCGSCRQVIAEKEQHQQHNIRIIMKGEKGKVYITQSASSLLPLMFKADKLKK